MIRNIFITSLPGVGKTTLIKEILDELKLDAGGFYTSEIVEKGVRKGFKIIALDSGLRISSVQGREGILAHQDIKSRYKVSKYGVNLKDLEEIGVKSILDALRENKICVIDEIGTMELFSEKFKEAVLDALNSQNKVLGTITLKPNPFCEKIKQRKDTKIFYLTRNNREKIKEAIKKLLWDEI
ncbi:MAG: NTPase [Nitrospirota bacterium]